jgi:hypothetical protein
MSPEQARGERVDGRSDIYASALILFEMIAGVGPFDDLREANELLLAHLAREAPPLSSLVTGVSPELERILASMLAKDCRQRPAHAREAAEQLRNFANRQRSLPTTDAPTARAGYGAETVTAEPRRERTPKPFHDALTRPEGAARNRPARDANASDDALTQPIALSPETTQVTLSVSTGESFSVGSAPNTTFVSPPSFDGTTTLQMSTVPTAAPTSTAGSGMHRSALAPSQSLGERPERTEMLGEFPAPGFLEPPDTRTHVPVAERPRPVSITPPPVVDTGRDESSGSARLQRVGRWAGLFAAGLGLLAALGFVLRRVAVPSENVAAVVAAAPTATPAVPAGREAPRAPESPGGELAAAPALAGSASRTMAAGGAAAHALSAGPVGAPTGSGSARNSMTFNVKQIKISPKTSRSLTSMASAGPTARNLATHPSPPVSVGSGL